MPFRDLKELSSEHMVGIENERDDVLNELKSLSLPPREPVSVPNGAKIAVSRVESFLDVQWLMI